MAAPHNKQRYGECWDYDKITFYLFDLEEVKDKVVFSGGWAWHFMSPPAHTELKHAHDHKDVDMFVSPENVVGVIQKLEKLGYKKVHTRFPPGKYDFRRYEKQVENIDGDKVKGLKFTVDFFVGDDFPIVEVDGWKVIEPKHLLSLYKSVHSSDNCFAVRAAAKLISKGINPIGREELIEVPE